MIPRLRIRASGKAAAMLSNRIGLQATGGVKEWGEQIQSNFHCCPVPLCGTGRYRVRGNGENKSKSRANVKGGFSALRDGRYKTKTLELQYFRARRMPFQAARASCL